MSLPARPAILVIDDAVSTRELVSCELENLIVVCAKTSTDIIRAFEDASLHIVAALVDMRPSHVNTSGVLALLRDEHPSVRRVLLVEFDPSESQVSLLGQAHACIAKPWARGALLDALATQPKRPVM